MVNDFPIQYRHDEMERNAYNAAFYELGFRWHWDRETYEHLLARSPNAAERIRHYLEAAQAHLLKAYDTEFLVDVILKKKIEHRKIGSDAQSAYFDWAQTRGCEVGV